MLSFKKFKGLHESSGLFVLPNAWDARSAVFLEEKKFPAVATSSAAVANSLGYEDGEGMPFSDYLFVIKRILSSVKIPVTVDVEMGYGNTNEAIYANIRRLTDLGVAGINMEDSVINGSKRSLRQPADFAKTIGYIKNKLVSDNRELFINVRCDTYILGVDNARKETSLRLSIYNSTGADGIFLPCITAAADIEDAIANTSLPLNVMCIPGLPDFATLDALGVKRVSMGPFLFQKVYASIGSLSQAIATSQSFAPLLA